MSCGPQFVNEFVDLEIKPRREMLVESCAWQMIATLFVHDIVDLEYFRENCSVGDCADKMMTATPPT